VHLVREDPAAVPLHHLGRPGHLVQRKHAAQRVVRAAEDEQVPADPERGVDPVQVQGEEPFVVVHLDLDDLAADQAWHDQERHVGRRRQDDRPAGPGEVRDRNLQRLDHVRNRTDGPTIDPPPEPALLEVGARRRQLVGEPRRQVPEGSVGGQPGHSVDDRRRGAEVHFRDCRAEPAGARSRRDASPIPELRAYHVGPSCSGHAAVLLKPHDHLSSDVWPELPGVDLARRHDRQLGSQRRRPARISRPSRSVSDHGTLQRCAMTPGAE